MAYEALYTRGRPRTFSHLVGQEHISNALTRAINSDRLSHAYLLVGTRGTGKTSTARLLAKAMNCDAVHEARSSGKILSAKEIPCNKCVACLSIDSSPDNVEFDAASNRSVEDVTRLLSTAHLAPLQSRVKTFIIDEVHMLSFEAVNSILKLIEEPPPNVAFFLATTELQKVPMTIRSRCQVLNFRLIPQEMIADHLGKFAKKLQVELEEDAAKKISRLAEGSMRDALTYLDQCYSMADEKISLDDVNETLGLISDADLDEIISAVKSQNRAQVGKAINHAFRSGLTSISIAESLITRLRDLEFELLDDKKNSELQELENFVDEIRKTILEMQGSGVPDIILEMSLVKLATPKIISVQPAPQKIIQAPVQNSAPQEDSGITLDGSLDEVRKIFYDTFDRLRNDRFLSAILKGVTVKNFSGDTVTLGFAGKGLVKVFLNNHKENFEKSVSKILGRNIKVEAVVDEKPSDAIFDRMNERDRKNLQRSAEIFQAEKIQKIDSEE